jgi:prepilin-type N-terminal cleavage/methylation domain-containing protein
MNFKQTKKAFTLVEILLTVTLLTIITATLYSFFSSGKIVYNRLKNNQIRYEPSNEFFQILRKDLIQLIQWNEISMVLNAEKLYFFRKNDNEYGKISKIEYRFIKGYEGNDKVTSVMRMEKVFPFDNNEKTYGISKNILLKNCKKFSCSLLGKVKKEISDEEMDDFEEDEKKEESYILKIFPKWKFNEFPIALEIRFQNNSNDPIHFKEWIPQCRYINIEEIPTLSIPKDYDFDKEEEF